jgi:hypothetical protein
VRGHWGKLLAVGSLVAAEAALGVLLVVNGMQSDPPPRNPWQINGRFPSPPPCSVVDHKLVSALAGADPPLDEDFRVDINGEPVRECTYRTARSNIVGITMRGRHTDLPTPVGITERGLSELRVDGNLTRHEVKRVSDYVTVAFEIDNLEVVVHFTKYGTRGELPSPQVALRMRDGTTALARQVADELAIGLQRWRTTPTHR